MEFAALFVPGTSTSSSVSESPKLNAGFLGPFPVDPRDVVDLPTGQNAIKINGN